MIRTTDRGALERLDTRLRTMLPEEYQDSYDDVQPVSMGSAGLKYDEDGRVAWHEIWQTFCDLAMAGGPPHKGVLLEPGTRGEIEAQPERYDEVVQEICRAVTLVADLYESTTNALIGHVIDRRRGLESGPRDFQIANSVTNTAEADRILSLWASRLRHALDDAR